MEAIGLHPFNIKQVVACTFPANPISLPNVFSKRSDYAGMALNMDFAYPPSNFIEHYCIFHRYLN